MAQAAARVPPRFFMPALTVRGTLTGLAALGLDATALAHSAGLAEIGECSPEAVVPALAVARLWREASARDPRPALPTVAGLAAPLGAFGVLAYLGDSAPDVAGHLRAVALNFRLAATAFTLDVDREHGHVRVLTPAGTPGRDASDECGIAGIVRGLQIAVGDGLRPARVLLTGPRPRHGRHAELYGAPVLFGAAHAGFDLPREAWRLPQRRADASLHAVLQELVNRVEPMPESGSLAREVRAQLRRLLPEGRARLPDLARALGSSSRTLHRRLGEAGTSFREALDEFRAAEAERLLLHGVALTEIALRLGFSDQTTWNRAFRRWKGTSPRAWAARARSG